jgi:hypothetical protein
MTYAPTNPGVGYSLNLQHLCSAAKGNCYGPSRPHNEDQNPAVAPMMRIGDCSALYSAPSLFIVAVAGAVVRNRNCFRLSEHSDLYRELPLRICR